MTKKTLTDKLYGFESIIKPLSPIKGDWIEIDASRMGSPFPTRAFQHNHLCVISAVESPEGEPEYHISITKNENARCSSQDAKWVLCQFSKDGWEEDNHVPFGKARHFWRPVAENNVGIECPCKEEEPAIVEDKGDYVWRPDSNAM